ncbi:hypothetical protein NQ176_g9877 [Zarea fungicola]|uniref:Uncharacterized protein n=1 Tax=Zarea fungicola TaxID=93591 RepID=A0ACC1MJI6_9HYPO|nr:hypothetical protein NQ176_g9877 [Lecanicillium fungicola]
MTTTFHPFPLLPPELRLKIWELAIRDTDVAGVNFVELDWHETLPLPNGLVATGHHNRRPGLLPASCAMKRQPCDHCDYGPTRGKCLRKNKSSYLYDSGLWDACRESRHVMFLKLRGSKRRLQRDEDAARSAHATLAFEGEDDNSSRHFTLFPRSDLFFMLHGVGHASGRKKRNRYLDTCFGPRHHTLQDVQHFAMNFNPVWGEERYGDHPASMQWFLAIGAGGLKSHVTLYVVDRRLVRRQEVPASSLLRHERVFHASNGVYVEIKDEDEWCYSEDGKVDLHPPIFEFMREINDYVDEAAEDEHARISILGWVPNIGKHIIPEQP